MFGIGFTELVVVLVVALIVIGPDKLPAVAKTLGKAFVELRRAGEEVKKSITDMNLESHLTNAGASRTGPGKKPAAKKTVRKEKPSASAPERDKKVT
ncbi:MAG: Sec-independent protein translocase protein TatB [Thermodesulfobacteriota bacterium]